MPKHRNPAELASEKALDEVYSCLDKGQSFRLEAGAGAGKTYSLVKALHYLIERYRNSMPRRNQKIACITFTNIAKDEILARIDKNPLVVCETNHSFCWSLIKGFQRQLQEMIQEIPLWQERIADIGGIGERTIEYTLGHRSIKPYHLYLHHNDILPLTIKLMESAKFRQLMVNQYPIILIDEYQDTDANWVEALKKLFLGRPNSPLFGFFGDHWQKIYGEGCGKIEHSSVKEISKEANFRSVPSVVNVLNRMRPELPQFVVSPEDDGSVLVFHTNNWTGERQTGSHWAGDLPPEVGHTTLEYVKDKLVSGGWDMSAKATKILMLTHRTLANEQGYPNLLGAFQYSDSLTAKNHPYIEYFVDRLEPACEAYLAKKFGAMFEALHSSLPLIRKPSDKVAWTASMNKLMELRAKATIGEVLDHLNQTDLPRLPDTIKNKERELQSFYRSNDDPLPDSLIEIEKFRAVKYSEMEAVRAYHSGFSPFETKHGVKGAEFENVLVIVGRGWSRYNFGEMLELASLAQIPLKKQETFERNRNLFYVACSRPKRRLALLFTQVLSSSALETITNWFGEPNTVALNFK